MEICTKDVTLTMPLPATHEALDFISIMNWDFSAQRVEVEDQEFKVLLDQIVSWLPAWAT